MLSIHVATLATLSLYDVTRDQPYTGTFKNLPCMLELQYIRKHIFPVNDAN